MAADLEATAAALAAYGSSFDPRLLSCDQASAVVALCARIEASAATIKALAAARAAEGPSWREEGFRSPADQLARQAGVGSSAARRILETGRRLGDQPEVAQAALSGDLSSAQAEMVSEGVAADPRRSAELLELAARRSLPELGKEVARVKAGATDEEARRRARHARRYLRSWVDLDGAAHAHLFGHPEDAMRVWQVLDPVRRRLDALRRADHPSDGADGLDSLEALDYDALVVISRLALGASDTELSVADLVDLGLFPQLADLATALLEDGAGDGGGRESDRDDASHVGVDVDLPAADLEDRRDGGDCPGEAVSLSLPGLTPAPARGSTLRPRQESRRPKSTSTPGADGDRARRRKGAGMSSSRHRRRLTGRPMKVFIRVDLESLMRGRAVECEQCEIDGYGPVAVSVVEDLLATEHPFVVGVLTKAKAVMGIYHHGRKLTAFQRSAVEYLQSECVVEGCHAHRVLDYDHRDDWAATHYTVADGIDRLCSHHHGLKTRANWALIGSGPKRPFVPPSDPRHPRHKPPADCRHQAISMDAGGALGFVNSLPGDNRARPPSSFDDDNASAGAAGSADENTAGVAWQPDFAARG
jgi:hypothetical protein